MRRPNCCSPDGLSATTVTGRSSRGGPRQLWRPSKTGTVPWKNMGFSLQYTDCWCPARLDRPCVVVLFWNAALCQTRLSA